MSTSLSASALQAPCPCGATDAKGRIQTLAACCGRFVGAQATQQAPDAAHLMRSRYTAFVLEDADYLLRTWDPAHCPAQLEFEQSAKWLGLQIKDACVTGPHTAEVEFVARFRVGGRAVRLHERSRFVQEDGVWRYVDGDMR